MHYHNCGDTCTGANCPNYDEECGRPDCGQCGIDFSMMDLQGMSADESIARKAARSDAARRATGAYFDALNATGNKEAAKFAARYAAAGQSIVTTHDHGYAWSSTRWTFGGNLQRCDSIIEIRQDEQTGRPRYMVRSLRTGWAFDNRRPGPRTGWKLGIIGDDAVEAGVYVRTIKIDGTNCAVFRVRWPAGEQGSETPHTMYYAQTEHLAWRTLENTGECDAPNAGRCRMIGAAKEIEYRPVQVAGFACN